MLIDESSAPASQNEPAWDTTSHEDFYRYYEKQSLSPATLARFRSTTDMLIRLFECVDSEQKLDVLDVGCGAGAQAKYWLDRDHRYWGIDINQPLIELARERARREGLTARFEVGSATSLPFADGSMDICVMPELLEHVQDWQSCVNEAVRILRPRGLLYIDTSSRLCPVQQEFNLPLYSWYPGAIKRYVERRAVTDWPAVANFAKYPAVNWFTFFQLRDYLRARGFDSSDRFDIAQMIGKGTAKKMVLSIILSIPMLRLLGHMLTPGTSLVARKSG